VLKELSGGNPPKLLFSSYVDKNFWGSTPRSSYQHRRFPPKSSFNAVMKLKNRRFSPESFVQRGRKTEEVLINTVEKPKIWGKSP